MFRPALLLSVLLAFTLIACAPGSVVIKPPDPLTVNAECDKILDALTAGKTGPSFIRAKVPNPCDAFRIVSTATKAGVIWEVWKVDEVVKWATEAKAKVAIGAMTYDGLSDMLMVQVAKLNQRLAGTYLLVSDMVVNIRSPALISQQDAAIADKALDVLIFEVKRMAALQS